MVDTCMKMNIPVMSRQSWDKESQLMLVDYYNRNRLGERPNKPDVVYTSQSCPTAATQVYPIAYTIKTY